MKISILCLFLVLPLFSSEKIKIEAVENISIPKVQTKLRRVKVQRERVNTFYISKYETSNKQWLNYLEQTIGLEGRVAEFLEKEEDKEEPVVNISWFEAKAFCKEQKGRLPTQLEWIVASSYVQTPSKCFSEVKKNRFYFFSLEDKHLSCLVEVLKEDEEDEIDLKRIFSMKYSVYESIENLNGTYGMFANVHEWVSDSIIFNHKEFRVIKGGSFKESKIPLMYDVRTVNILDPHTRQDNLGFRCVWDKE